MKIRNSEFKFRINASSILKNLQLEGLLTLSLIQNKKQMVEMDKNYAEAYTEILNSRCKKDKQGNPILQYQKDQEGNDILDKPQEYSFINEEQKRDATNEFKNLSQTEVELKLATISSHSLAKISQITPEQMEALLLMVPLAD